MHAVLVGFREQPPMSFRDRLLDFYWKIEGFITPGLKYAHTIYEEVLKAHVSPGTRWLDLGCGHQLLPPWRAQQERLLASVPKTLIGIDSDAHSLAVHRSILQLVRGDISDLPFRDSSFDLATANMVVEHLDAPETQLREVARVLRPGGLFIFHTPNALAYATIAARAIPQAARYRLARIIEGRDECDVFPTHYRINSTKRISAVAEALGFTVVQLRLVCSTAELAVILPLAAVELAWIRLTMTRSLRQLRTNIIAILEKP